MSNNNLSNIELNYPDDTSCKLSFECSEDVSHWDGDYYASAYDKSRIFEKFAAVVASPLLSENSVIERLDLGFHLEDFDSESDRSGESWESFVAQKLREANDRYEFVTSSLDAWDRKRGTLTMLCQVETCVGALGAALKDERISKEILENWCVWVAGTDGVQEKIYAPKSEGEE